MRKPYYSIFLWMMALLAGVACSKDLPMEEEVLPSAFEQRELVQVQLFLGVEPEQEAYCIDGTVVETPPDTKADPFPYDTGWGAYTGNDRETHSIGDLTRIWNVWVLEFEQVGEQYVLNAQPTYVSNYPSYFETPYSENQPKTVGIPASRYNCTLLFLANTGNPDMVFTPGMTLEEFKESQYAAISSQANLFNYDKQADSLSTLYPETYPAEKAAKGYLPRFNGTLRTRVDPTVYTIGTKDDRIQLKRAMARVDIIVDNKSLDLSIPIKERIHLRSLRINNVQDRSFYYTNYSDYMTSKTIRRPSTPSPLDISEGNYDWDMQTTNEQDWAHIIKVGNTITLTDESVTVPQYAHARFYLPGNIRGENDLGATSVTLVGQFVEDGITYQATYTFPIKETYKESGQTKYCYAVRPNYHYTIKATINRRGESSASGMYVDGVIDYVGKELANSYILNPPPTSDLFNVYKFPVAKINKFWADPDYALNSQVLSQKHTDGKKTGADLYLRDDTDWTAYILWSDFDCTGKVELLPIHASKLTGAGAPSPSEIGRGRGTDGLDMGCFAVKVQGGTQGNVVVAVKRNVGSRDYILWSWHLWITDYNPDTGVEPAGGDAYKWYLHTVSNGKVFRMNNPIFNTGRYRKSYMMDRYLGSWFNPVDLIDEYWNASFSELNSMNKPGQGLFYEFGRKDPTLGSTGSYYYKYTRTDNKDVAKRMVKERKSKQTTEWTVLASEFARVKNYSQYAGSNPDKDLYYSDKSYSGTYLKNYDYKNVPLSVMYPMMYICGNGADYIWTKGDQYHPVDYDSQILWQDPNFTRRDNDDASKVGGYRKSMFDPCPPGWALPYKQERIDDSGNIVYDNVLDNLTEGTAPNCKYWYPILVPTKVDNKDFNDLRGVLVWPEGRVIPNVIDRTTFKDAIFFPRIGSKDKGEAPYYYNYPYLYMWTASPEEPANNGFGSGCTTVISRTDVFNDARDRSSFYPVRCVKNNVPD